MGPTAVPGNNQSLSLTIKTDVGHPFLYFKKFQILTWIWGQGYDSGSSEPPRDRWAGYWGPRVPQPSPRADTVSFRDLARSDDEEDEEDEEDEPEQSDLSSGLPSDTDRQPKVYFKAKGHPTVEVTKRTASLVLQDREAPELPAALEMRAAPDLPEPQDRRVPQPDLQYAQVHAPPFTPGTTFDSTKDGQIPTAGGEIFGWPSNMPDMSKPQAAPPSPSSDEDGHQGYFLGRVSPLKSPSHKPKPIRKVNPALFKVNFAHLIEQKQQWYAAHGSSPSVEDSPEPIQETVEDDIPLIDESIHLPSRPKGTHRRKGVSRHVNPKHRKKARGNNPNDPITIDLSPSRPSTSRAVHDQRVQDSRATLKSRRDHISTVAQPILRFPHMDFIDRPGLAAAHGDPYPVDPAGDPWPNSIVSFPPVNHSLNLPCPHIPRSPWMKVLHLVTST